MPQNRRTETYRLINARNIAAFEQLLEEEDEDESYKPRRGSRGPKNAKPKRDKEKFVKLRDDVERQGSRDPAAGADGNYSSSTALAELQAMFRGRCEASVVEEVLAGCGGDHKAACRALLDITAASEPASGNSNLWDGLPADLKHRILSHFGFKELQRMATTCREFAERVRLVRDSAARVDVIKGLGYSLTVGMVASFRYATSVSLRGLGQEATQAEVESALAAVCEAAAKPSRRAPIRRLACSRLPGLTDSGLQLLLCSLESLQQLDLSDCPGITPRGINMLARYQRMEQLQQQWKQWEEQQQQHWEQWEQQEEAALREQEQQQLAGSSTHALQQQQQQQQEQVPPALSDGTGGRLGSSMAALAIGSRPDAPSSAAAPQAAGSTAEEPGTGPGLRCLDLSGCSQLPNDAVRTLLTHPNTKRSLTSLDVSRNSRITNALNSVAHTGSLQHLKASRCPSVPRLVLQLPASQPLRHVNISGCASLEHLLLSLPNLQVLEANDCRQLCSVSLRCPKLRSASFAGCAELACLQAEQWRCPAMQLLNLHSCRRLTTASVAELLPACPLLQSLDLNGAWSLAQLATPHNPQLRSLDISGCSQLVSANLGSSPVQELVAVACGALQQLVLQPWPLRRLELTNCGALADVVLVAREGPPPPAAPKAGAAAGEGRQGACGGARVVLDGCSRLQEPQRRQLQALRSRGAC